MNTPIDTNRLRPKPSDYRVPLAFILANFALRYALIGLNQGAYTDGILQITQFERADSFWPPLYTAMIWMLRAIGAEPVWAARLIVAVMSSSVCGPKREGLRTRRQAWATSR